MPSEGPRTTSSLIDDLRRASQTASPSGDALGLDLPGQTHVQKFVNIPLPGVDKGVNSLTDSIERRTSFHSPEMLAGIGGGIGAMDVVEQMQVPHNAPARVGKEMSRIEAAQLRPADVLGRSIAEVERLDYWDLMLWDKRYRKAGDNGAHYGDDPAKVDECWRRCMVVGARAFELQPKDLLLTHFLDNFHERGLTRKFPEETARLLEVGIKMKVGGGNKRRFEFFDTYYDFQRSRGKLDEAFVFVLQNLDVFSNMDIRFSTAFNDLLKHQEEGDQVRLQMMKMVYQECKGFNGGHSMGTAVSAAFSLMAVTIFAKYAATCCVQLKGDYRKANRIIDRGEQFVASAENRTAQLDGSEGNDVRQMWEERKRAVTQLIPPYDVGFFDGTGDQGVQALPSAAFTQAETRYRTKDIRYKALWGTALRDKNMGEAYSVLKKAYNDEDIPADIYFAMLTGFLRLFAEPDSAEPSEIVSAIDKLLNHEDSPKIPLEVRGVCVARLLEAEYALGNHAKVIEVFEQQLREGRIRGRGAAYYYVKSCFECADRSAETVADGIKVAAEFLPQFETTEWELELLEGYLVPNYPGNEDSFYQRSGQKRALPALATLTEDNPDNVTYDVVFVRTILKTSKNSDRFLAAAIVMNKKGRHAEGPWALLLADTNRQVASTLAVAGKFVEVRTFIKGIPNFADDSRLKEKYCSALLHPKNLSRAQYDEVCALLDGDEALAVTLKALIDRAKELLKVTTTVGIQDRSFVKRLLASDSNLETIGADDGVKMTFLFGEAREVSDFHRENIQGHAEDGLDWTKFSSDRKVDDGVLSKPLTIQNIRFERGDKGCFVAVCELKREEGDLKREVVKLHIDEDLSLKIRDFKYKPADEAQTKLMIRILEATLLEEISERLDGETIGLAGDMFESRGRLDQFRRRVAEYEKSLSAPSIDVEGIEGITARNEQIIGRLLERLPEMEKEMNFPAREEVDGLISRYIELVRTCRDLDDPVVIYNGATDSRNPFAGCVQNLKIFNRVTAVSELEACGVKSWVLRKYGLNTERKSNLSGYYELECTFDDAQNVPIAVFLDERGVAHIPGIEKDHPLYRHLWLLAVESLAGRVVPEIRPYSRFFKKKPSAPGDKAPLKKLSVSPFDTDDPASQKKRLCCSALVLDDDGETDGEPGQKLSVLDDITDAFNMVDLGEKDISQWPLYYKNGRRFERIDGLFTCEDGGTCVAVDKLKRLVDFDNFPSEATEDLLDGEMVSIEYVHQLIRQKLMDIVRVRTVSSRAYRMHVGFSLPRHRVEEIEGEEFYLVPVKGEGRKRKTVERGGQHYRLDKVPPHTKVQIDGQTFFAIPYQMTPEMRDICRRDSLMDIDLSPIGVMYGVLYNSQTGELLAQTYIGPSKQDEAGTYVNGNVRRYMATHSRGDLAMMLDRKVAAEFDGDEHLAEAIFPVFTNVGFKQGVFPKVWQYLQAERGIQDAAIRMLVDGMRRKLDAQASAAFESELAELDKSPAPVAKVKARDEVARVRTVKQPDFYRINTAIKGSSDYAGLHDTDLLILDENHPMYAEFARALDIGLPKNAGKVIVLVGGPHGRPSKVPRKLLVKVVEDPSFQ